MFCVYAFGHSAWKNNLRVSLHKGQHTCLLWFSVDGNALERAYRVDTLVAIVARLRILLTLVDVCSRARGKKQKQLN